MKSLSLKAFPRALAKRSRVKKLRASGRVPAVIYGRQTQAQNLEVGVKEIEDLIHHSVSETILVDLEVEGEGASRRLADRKSTRLNSSHGYISYAVFCLKKKKKNKKET